MICSIITQSGSHLDKVFLFHPWCGLTQWHGLVQGMKVFPHSFVILLLVSNAAPSRLRWRHALQMLPPTSSPSTEHPLAASKKSLGNHHISRSITPSNCVMHSKLMREMGQSISHACRGVV